MRAVILAMTLCVTTALHAQVKRVDSSKHKESDTLVSKKALEEVVIRSRQPVVEAGSAPGTIVFQVARSADAAGQTALETLKKAPGVSIDNNAVISLNGRTGVTIMLDGKLTYLSGREIIDLLQSMPSSSIRSIELVGSPGAKYDASGTAGIINIRTIKMQGTGFNGAINTGLNYGITLKQNLDVSLNYRQNRWNYFASYNHFIGNYTYDYGSDRFQDNRSYSSATYDIDKRKRINTRGGIDYSISEKQTIGVVASANFIPGGGRTETRTLISQLNTPVTEQVLDAINDYYYQSTERYNFNLNYQYEDKSGHQFNADADYGFFTKGNRNLQSNRYSDRSMALQQQNLYRTLNNIDIRLHAFKLDYATPFGQGKLETGIKYAAVRSVNDGSFYHVVGKDSLDPRRSNRFGFSEAISSGYLAYQRTVGKWSWQAGLRVEHTANNSDTTNRVYTNLFPSASISYKYADRQSLSIAYARRIDRPAYPDLNPFIYLLDELSFWQGNPYLQPQLTHRLALQWVYRNTTILGLTYANTAGYFARITDTVGGNKIMMIPRNIGRQTSVALTLTQNSIITPWWDLTFNSTLSFLHNKIAYAAYTGFDVQQLAARLHLVQRVKLSASLSGEITGVYNSPRLTAANERSQATSQVDVALAKTFSSRLSVRLALNDIYKGSRLFTEQDMGGYNIRSYSYYETQQLRLNISYRFADKNSKAPRNRVSALEAENGRIK